MSEWKEYKLSEYLVVNPKIQTIKDARYSFIKMEDLNPSYKYVEPSDKRTANGLTKFQNGDTLFAKITPCLENGKIAQARNLEDNIGVGSTEFFVYRGKQNISDNDFIYYLLRSYPVKEYAVRNMTGSAGHQRVPSDVFDYLYIKLPNYDESVEIGKFFSFLDSKIDLLRRQNLTLENIAQTLFKRWFIDFEFPDKDGNPYKSSGGKMVESELGEIPVGWRAIELSNIISFAKGKKPKETFTESKEGCMAQILIDTLDGGNPDFAKHDKMIIADLLDPIMVMDGASSGRTEIGFKGIIGSTLAKIIVNEDLCGKNIVYQFLKCYEKDIMSNTTGTSIPHTDKDKILSYEIALPDFGHVLNNYENIALSLRNKVVNNKDEIVALTKTRDILLPKLMSGQIRVKDL